jgi:hypothetical protein
MKIKTQHTRAHRMKKVLKKILIINAYIQKEETSRINNLTSYLKTLEKEEQTKSKRQNRRKQ